MGSRTSVLNIFHPVVSIYTHRHKIENFEILNFFGFNCHHWRVMEFFALISCAFGCTYLDLLGVRTCSGPFRSISKHQKCSRSDALLQTPFWVTSQKTTFCTFLAPMEVSKLRFGAYRQNFLGASGAPNMLKNGQKGLPRCRKAPINVQNILGVLRKPFPNFRKIVEFSTFRQHSPGQLGIVRFFFLTR